MVYSRAELVLEALMFPRTAASISMLLVDTEPSQLAGSAPVKLRQSLDMTTSPNSPCAVNDPNTPTPDPGGDPTSTPTHKRRLL